MTNQIMSMINGGRYECDDSGKFIKDVLLPKIKNDKSVEVTTNEISIEDLIEFWNKKTLVFFDKHGFRHKEHIIDDFSTFESDITINLSKIGLLALKLFKSRLENISIEDLTAKTKEHENYYSMYFLFIEALKESNEYVMRHRDINYFMYASCRKTEHFTKGFEVYEFLRDSIKFINENTELEVRCYPISDDTVKFTISRK